MRTQAINRILHTRIKNKLETVTSMPVHPCMPTQELANSESAHMCAGCVCVCVCVCVCACVCVCVCAHVHTLVKHPFIAKVCSVGTMNRRNAFPRHWRTACKHQGFPSPDSAERSITRHKNTYI